MTVPGTTKLKRLEENIGAASLELTPDLRAIDAAASTIRIEGAVPRAVQARWMSAS